MNKKVHTVLDFIKLPIAQKVEFGRNAYTKMKGNPRFPTPDVSLEDMESVTNELEARSVAAQGGGKELTALMHQTEEDWINLLRTQARYVDRVADGDSAAILSAGFNLSKQPAPYTRPEFSVELGEKSGCVTLRRHAVEGARSYTWQYCIGEAPAAESQWITMEVTSRASVELSGLTPLTKYWFRSAAVTPLGTTDYTSPIMQVVI